MPPPDGRGRSGQLLANRRTRELVRFHSRKARIQRRVLGLLDCGKGVFDRVQRVAFSMLGGSLGFRRIELALLRGESLVSLGDVLIPRPLGTIPRIQDLSLLSVGLLA